MKGARRLGLYVGGAQHAAKHIRQYEAAKKDMPVAVAIGVDPTIVLASISKFPYGTDELCVAGGLRGEPVPMVPCETVDLEVPANAEIVLEGFMRSGHREQEGPFGEFSGYMSPGGQQPVIELTCVTRRRAPIYHSFLSQMPRANRVASAAWAAPPRCITICATSSVYRSATFTSRKAAAPAAFW